MHSVDLHSPTSGWDTKLNSGPLGPGGHIGQAHCSAVTYATAPPWQAIHII